MTGKLEAPDVVTRDLAKCDHTVFRIRHERALALGTHLGDLHVGKRLAEAVK